ncbi:phosphotransferase family protein [Nocardiopsis protaetiae]|uniref:phosphotransferase family protein n=1 Tax=Nocardiopsis protaetiae TaxID=3382270 RepID=UPI00387A8D87
MLDRVLESVRTGLPATAPPRVGAALGRPRAVVLGSYWEGRTVYALFAPRERVPALVVKVDTNDDYKPRLYREHEALRRVAATPAMAGLAPAPLGVYACGGSVALAQTAVPGVPLNVLLRRRLRHGVRRSARDHAGLLSWLATFRGSGPGSGTGSGDTVTVEPGTVAERLARALPADAPGSAELAEWVAAEGPRFGPVPVPVRPLHGDLGPSNCFVHRGRVRVVDWEGALAQGPPLAETLVFLNHYARAVPGADTRLRRPTDTFREAFLGRGWLGTLTWDTWRRELYGLGVPAEADRYLFTATLVDLAAGRAATAHAARRTSQNTWKGLLALYAAERRPG